MEEGPDGIVRPRSENQRIGLLLLTTFRTEVGRQALDYLRQITIYNVTGPNVTDTTLRHLEGQRHLVAIIEQEMRRAEQNLAKDKA